MRSIYSISRSYGWLNRWPRSVVCHCSNNILYILYPNQSNSFRLSKFLKHYVCGTIIYVYYCYSIVQSYVQSLVGLIKLQLYRKYINVTIIPRRYSHIILLFRSALLIYNIESDLVYFWSGKRYIYGVTRGKKNKIYDALMCIRYNIILLLLYQRKPIKLHQWTTCLIAIDISKGSIMDVWQMRILAMTFITFFFMAILAIFSCFFSDTLFGFYSVTNIKQS